MASPSTSPALSRSRWANLADGPAGLITECLLAHDIADYLRFRAVCGSWRQCSDDPHTHDGLDRRFHPWRWVLLLETHAVTDRCRRFLNLSTGECIKVCLPELRDHEVLAQTCEGLLVLIHHDRTHVRLLNPLTRHLTQLPPLTTLLPQKEQDHLLNSPASDTYFAAWGSGVLDDSTMVLCFNSLNMLGVAKPGDARWTLITFPSGLRTTSSTLQGRFYCVTKRGFMVLKDQPWRMEVAANLHIVGVSPMEDSVHLVESAGELMLVYRRFSWNNWRKKRSYDVYRVDLDVEALCRVDSLGDGGRALFLGMRWSLSVPIGVFSAGSISGDTIYLRFDIEERDKIESCHLAYRSIKPAAASYNLGRGLVAQQHTLVDFISLCSTGQI